MPDGSLTLELHNSLNTAIVVVDVDGADHLGALELPNAERDLADGVTAHELHELSCCCEL